MIAKDDQDVLVLRVAQMINWYGFAISGHAMRMAGFSDDEVVTPESWPVPWEDVVDVWMHMDADEQEATLALARAAIYG